MCRVETNRDEEGAPLKIEICKDRCLFTETKPYKPKENNSNDYSNSRNYYLYYN